MGRCVYIGCFVYEFISSRSSNGLLKLARLLAATTVAATMWLAHAAGISTFVTGESTTLDHFVKHIVPYSNPLLIQVVREACIEEESFLSISLPT